MNKPILSIALALAAFSATAQTKKPVAAKPVAKPVAKSAASTAVFKNNIDSVSYAVGVRILQNLKSQGLANVNMTLLQKAMNDVAQNKTILLDDAAMQACMNEFQQKVYAVKAEEQRKE